MFSGNYCVIGVFNLNWKSLAEYGFQKNMTVNVNGDSKGLVRIVKINMQELPMGEF